MREMWIVIGREFSERVRSKGFLLSTVLLPLFAVGVFLIPFLVERAGGGGGEYHVALVDEAPEGVGDRLMEILSAEPGSEREERFRVERIDRPLDEVQDSLTALVADEELDGYLWIGEDFVDGDGVLYRARNVTNMSRLQRLRGAASEAVRSERLDRAGLDGTEVAALMRPAQMTSSRITRTGEEGASTISTMVFAYIVAFVLYMFILLYGTQVMQSVHEEKTNRIAEVLMSSIRAPQLLAGKIFGVGGAALLQMLIWGGLAALVVSQRVRIATAMDIPPELFDALQLDPGVGVLLLLYALLGFFLYAAIFAAVGAATQDMQEAQQFVWVLILPLFVPLILQFQLVSEPHGTLSTAVGWIPLTAPLAMPIRMGATEIAALEIAGSLLILAATLAAVAWAAGKIYRVGMLSTGKRPSLKELARWVRTA